MANAIYVGTYHKVRLLTPLQWMTKAEIARAAIENIAPLELTMSCYNGKEPACGVCPTCVGRIAAFQEIGVIDPIDYEVEVDWSGCVNWDDAIAECHDIEDEDEEGTVPN